MNVVFPAYAGVILFSAKLIKGHFGVPRVCGGDPITASR